MREAYKGRNRDHDQKQLPESARPEIYAGLRAVESGIFRRKLVCSLILVDRVKEGRSEPLQGREVHQRRCKSMLCSQNINISSTWWNPENQFFQMCCDCRPHAIISGCTARDDHILQNLMPAWRCHAHVQGSLSYLAHTRMFNMSDLIVHRNERRGQFAFVYELSSLRVQPGAVDSPLARKPGITVG